MVRYSDTFVMAAVAAVIEDEAGRVLLCQQQGGHRFWGLPGGKIKPGESPTHAVVRDVREETGSETEIVDLVGLYTVTGDGCGEDMPDLQVHVFRGRLATADVNLNHPGRVACLAWHDPGALPEPLTATTRTAIADATAGRAGLVTSLQRDA